MESKVRSSHYLLCPIYNLKPRNIKCTLAIKASNLQVWHVAEIDIFYDLDKYFIIKSVVKLTLYFVNISFMAYSILLVRWNVEFPHRAKAKKNCVIERVENICYVIR